MDFGAGKLRNILYLLEQGYQVYSVEYEKVSTQSSKAKEMYSKAESYKDQFHKIVFPHEFFSMTDKFDLILLINVCTVIPVLSERFLVLQYCRSKLKENGYLLWYSQHNDADTKKKCTESNRIADGYYMNETREYQTFYKDIERYEIDGMFLSNGFREFNKYPAGKNIAKLYKMSGSSPITPNVLTASIIRQYVKGDEELKEKTKTGIKLVKQKDNPVINDPLPSDCLKKIFMLMLLVTYRQATHLP